MPNKSDNSTIAGQSNNLYEFVSSGNRVLMDGALGTELERRSIDVYGDSWSALAVENEGDVIVDIHVDYINAGAKLHIANSFSLGRHVLETVGQESRFEALNRASVQLVNQAIEKTDSNRGDYWVAGSVSTFFTDSDRSLLPGKDILFKNCLDQMEFLVDEGIDVIALEMLADYSITESLLGAAEQFGLPIIVGITCEWGADGVSVETHARSMGLEPILLDDLLPQIIQIVTSRQVIFAIMHTEPDVTDSALPILKHHWDGPVAVYPNSGVFSKDQGIALDFDSVQPVQQFSEAARNWIAGGVDIVGGCCGIGPDHIASLHQAMENPGN
jgi:S-methylmethionine-dependent homocysteine/selenocysteine methylase